MATGAACSAVICDTEPTLDCAPCVAPPAARLCVWATAPVADKPCVATDAAVSTTDAACDDTAPDPVVLACATPAAAILCVFVTLLDVDAPGTALAAPTSLCVWAISPAAELAACETFAAAMGLATTESK